MTTQNRGAFAITDSVQLNLSVSIDSIIQYLNYDNPFYAESYFNADFSDDVSIDVLIEAYRSFRSFLRYITFRNNVQCHHVDIVMGSKDQSKELVGKYHHGIMLFPKFHDVEQTDKAKEQVIPYDCLKEKTADLMYLISQKIMKVEFLPDSIDDAIGCSTTRAFRILANFEREFENIYGKNAVRSVRFKESKNIVLQNLATLSENYEGRRREDIRKIAKVVKNLDDSFAFRVRHALTDCQTILLPFIHYYYRSHERDILDNISDRIGNMRNSIVHSKLDFELGPIDYLDLQIMQTLTYAMRLKNIGINNQNVKKAIARLFSIPV